MTIYKQTVAMVLITLSSLCLPQASWAESREDKAWSLIQQNALVIDVRTTEEYANGHLKNALHIPYQQIAARFAQLEIRNDRPVVLYCRSGNRSGIAEKILFEQGYTALHNGGGLGGLVQAQP